MQKRIQKETGNNCLKRIIVAFLAVIMMTTMLHPQMVQAATYQKTIKNKSVKKPEVLVGADKVKVFSIKVKEIGKQIQEAETTEPSDDTKNQDGESAQQEEKTTEITEKTETTDITTETTEEAAE